MKYLIGFIVIAIGYLIIWKTEWLVSNLGRVEWAEQHLGTEGGTRIFYKLIGIMLIIGAFLAMSGAFNALLKAIFGGAFKGTTDTGTVPY